MFDYKQFLSVTGWSDSLESRVVYVLAKVYARVPWRKVARGRDPLDVFQHRVLAASYQQSFAEFLEKLCRGLGIQSVRVESDVLESIKRDESKALEMLRKQSIYLVAKTWEATQKIFESVKRGGGDAKNKQS